jgi:hypothetical protein
MPDELLTRINELSNQLAQLRHLTERRFDALEQRLNHLDVRISSADSWLHTIYRRIGEADLDAFRRQNRLMEGVSQIDRRRA